MIDIAFYTCYLGPDRSWSNQVHDPPSRDLPCYYFTNNLNTFEAAKKKGWKPVWMDVPIDSDEVRNSENTKLLRCCPHLFEQLYKYSHLCYLDSKVWVTDLDTVLTLASELTDETPLVLSLHNSKDRYTTVWGEFNEAMLQERYARHKDRYVKYIKSRLRMGYRNEPLRHLSGFRIQKQCDLMRRIGETWFSHIQLCGIECQISWQFVIQEFPGAVRDIPYKSCWSAP